MSCLSANILHSGFGRVDGNRSVSQIYLCNYQDTIQLPLARRCEDGITVSLSPQKLFRKCNTASVAANVR